MSHVASLDGERSKVTSQRTTIGSDMLATSLVPSMSITTAAAAKVEGTVIAVIAMVSLRRGVSETEIRIGIEAVKHVKAAGIVVVVGIVRRGLEGHLVVLNVNLVVLGLITWGGVGLVATNIAVAAVDVALILLYHQAVEVVHVGHLAHVAAKIY